MNDKTRIISLLTVFLCFFLEKVKCQRDIQIYDTVQVSNSEFRVTNLTFRETLISANQNVKSFIIDEQSIYDKKWNLLESTLSIGSGYYVQHAFTDSTTYISLFGCCNGVKAEFLFKKNALIAFTTNQVDEIIVTFSEKSGNLAKISLEVQDSYEDHTKNENGKYFQSRKDQVRKSKILCEFYVNGLLEKSVLDESMLFDVYDSSEDINLGASPEDEVNLIRSTVSSFSKKVRIVQRESENWSSIQEND